MVTFFVVIAWILALLSGIFVSQATAGVAGIAFACFMAIAARIHQADQHQRQMLRFLESQR